MTFRISFLLHFYILWRVIEIECIVIADDATIAQYTRAATNTNPMSSRLRTHLGTWRVAIDKVEEEAKKKKWIDRLLLLFLLAVGRDCCAWQPRAD